MINRYRWRSLRGVSSSSLSCVQDSGHTEVRGYLSSCWDRGRVSSLPESLLSRLDHSAYTASEPTHTQEAGETFPTTPHNKPYRFSLLFILFLMSFIPPFVTDDTKIFIIKVTVFEEIQPFITLL